jgi:hypothetical protein
MTRARITGGKGTLKLDESGILRLVWNRGETIGADDAQAAIIAVNKLCRSQSHPMLVNVSDVALTRGARIAFTSPSGASRIALLGSSPVDRVIASFFLALQSLPCPTRYFTSTADALSWLTLLPPETDATPQSTDAPAQLPARRTGRRQCGEERHQ